ncbi:D-alanyl-D-alanine carboxypeptidase family protein [Desulfovibrio aminophilus]|nr:D-alanyl-D-alanine carboxypeptidase family protein [Desulfovibrio aminophilus]
MAKEPDWVPPKRRMSLVAGGLGGHTKPNSHGDQQPYDELGRYAGPGEGAWSEKPKEEKPRDGSLLSAFLETPEGGGRDVLDERFAYGNQGKDESEYRGKANLEPEPQIAHQPVDMNYPGLVRVVLPKKFETDLNPEFAARLERFTNDAKSNGIRLVYISGYRSAERQAIIDEPVKAKPGMSSHQGGLAADIPRSDWKKLPAQQKAALEDLAKKHGLLTGKPFGDPNHFYIDEPSGAKRREWNEKTSWWMEKTKGTQR